MCTLKDVATFLIFFPFPIPRSRITIFPIREERSGVSAKRYETKRRGDLFYPPPVYGGNKRGVFLSFIFSCSPFPISSISSSCFHSLHSHSTDRNIPPSPTSSHRTVRGSVLDSEIRSLTSRLSVLSHQTPRASLFPQ